MRRTFLAALLAIPFLSACAPAELRTPEARLVFFGADSTELDPPSRAVVAEAAQVANRYPALPVTVVGYAASGRTAAPQADAALSQRRAEAVAAALRASNVAATRIAVVPVGPMPYESVPQENRRVEIRIGG